MIETELFAPGYRRYGLVTVRHPVLEVEAVVEPFEKRPAATPCACIASRSRGGWGSRVRGIRGRGTGVRKQAAGCLQPVA
jgi:hypothetical protein